MDTAIIRLVHKWYQMIIRIMWTLLISRLIALKLLFNMTKFCVFQPQDHCQIEQHIAFILIWRVWMKFLKWFIIILLHIDYLYFVMSTYKMVKSFIQHLLLLSILYVTIWTITLNFLFSWINWVRSINYSILVINLKLNRSMFQINHCKI